MQVAYLDFKGNGNSIQTREKKISNKLPGQQRNDDVKENPTGKIGIEFVGQMDPMIVNKKFNQFSTPLKRLALLSGDKQNAYLLRPSDLKYFPLRLRAVLPDFHCC